MAEAYEEMRELSGVGPSSDDEDPDTDKNPYRRRGKNKHKYVVDITLFGYPIQIDHCLCARLILAGVMLWIIGFILYTCYTVDLKRREKH